ncbi:MAG: hypothetical protein MJ201_01500 [Mycoplasmoidaceae bacterium]|nr:hypothetical protein [Mycoplasmoidaceae bacterium]
MIKNQEIYESRLDDLKKTSELLVEQLKKNEKLVPIGKYITEKKIINRDFKIKKLFGLNNQNGFQKPSSMSKGSDIRRYKCVSYNDIVYPPPHFGEIGTIGIFKNDAGVVSPMYTVFAVNQNELYPDYLMI